MFTNGTRKVVCGLDRGSEWQEEKQEKMKDNPGAMAMAHLWVVLKQFCFIC